MADPSAGFCAFAEATVSTNAAASVVAAAAAGTPMVPRGSTSMTQLTPAWQEPSLQIIDVQVQPLTVPDADDDDQRHNAASLLFYVLLSDGQAVVWSVVPPGSPIAALLFDREIEPGCMVTLHDYTVIPATGNGRAVLVLLDVSCDPAKLSLIGDPQMQPAQLFKLSPQALRRAEQVNAGASISRAGSLASAAGRGRSQSRAPDPAAMRPVALSALFEPGSDFTATAWRVTVRVIWRSRLRKVMPRDASASQAAPSAQTALKYVFDCRVVDADGNGALAVFWGGRERYGVLRPGATVLLGHASVRRPKDAGASTAPVAIEVNDRSVVIALDPPGARSDSAAAPDDGDGDGDDDGRGRRLDDLEEEEDEQAQELRERFAPERPLPTRIGSDLCPLERDFVDVATALDAAVGSTVSVIACVLRAFPVAAVQTRRGRVDKRELVLAPVSAAVSTAAALTSAATVRVTLWGPHSAVECAPREVWCFKMLKVGMFGSNKVLSSKGSSEIVPRDALFALPTSLSGAQAGPPQPQADPANPYAGRDIVVMPPPPVAAEPSAEPLPVRATPSQPAPLPSLGGPLALDQLCLTLRAALDHAAARAETVMPPTMLRVARVSLPLHRLACPRCGGDPAARSGTPFRACRRRPDCLAASPTVVFEARVLLSDGVDDVPALFAGPAGERLIGCTAAEFATIAAGDAGFLPRVARDLTAMPLVAQLGVQAAADTALGPLAPHRHRVHAMDLTDFAVLADAVAASLRRSTTVAFAVR